MSEPAGLLGGMFGMPPDWLAALLDVEAALAAARAETGRIGRDIAKEISDRCRPELFDADAIADRTAAHATPVVPIVEDLRGQLSPAAAAAVHKPATSQDIVDTAMMLIASRRIDVIVDDLDSCVLALDRLISDDGDIPQVARTLLARALPTTFGRLVAVWRAGVSDAWAALDRVHETLAVQLGGPVGSLDDPLLLAAFAAELDLAVPESCWHTNRMRIADLAAALGMVTGSLGKIAGDVVLLAQAELGELAEGEPGRSSAMPDKKNSARSVQILACAHRTPGLVGTVFSLLPQEFQRAAGRWQAEWQPVGELLALTMAAARHSRVLLGELTVDAARMGEHLT